MGHSGNSADRRRSRRRAKKLAVAQADRKPEAILAQTTRKVELTTQETDSIAVPTVAQTDRKLELRIDGSLTVVLALIPFGYQMLGFPNASIVGLCSWAVSLVFIWRIVWLVTEPIGAYWRLSLPSVLVLTIIAAIWSPVSRRILGQVLPPDFPHNTPPHINAPTQLPMQRPTVKPDIRLRFVRPEDVSFELVNPSQAVVNDPKFWFVLMDLDVPGKNILGDLALPDLLPIPAEIQRDYIRPGDHSVPRSIVTYYPGVSTVVKPKHRLFGYATITCPDCIKERSFWLYFVQGSGGWYSEFERQELPDRRNLLLSTDDTLNKLVPTSKRTMIAGIY